MKYTPLKNTLYIENRKKIAQLMMPNAIAVFNSNDIMPTNADGTLPFRQNNDLLYVSGVDQEESIVLLFPNAINPKHREILFVKETSELIAIWEGAKFSKEQATKQSGIETVYWTSQFEAIFHGLTTEANTIYLYQNEHLRAVNTVETCSDRFRKMCQTKYPLHNYERLAPLMSNLRATKHPLEIEAIQHASNITEKGLRRILNFVKPGVMEYEIEAEFIHEFIKNRSNGFAYQPIIASGYNACVLHYIENNAQCKAGDVILLDVGAEYANYASDMTRCIPVSGKFTPRQKEVYNAVLRVMKAATAMLVSGTKHDEYHIEVGNIMQSELIGLGLIDKHDVAKQDKNNPLYKKYFMHGTSHHMGLDVHDVENRNRPFEAGMVLTVEPGIYIREENLGIRLENDVLITNDKPFDLMKNIPLEADEIEELMN
ncbi:MAG: X-Pro aminopeptidase [Flavobacteriales bacterium CG18_big_fil_WC_8_21_14_2_50_32_9]|nr:MAG: X-Pro aminopeptidase [Flavobacteriales bacterium CG18_big_fil_WC_8_21_14_2_50_32_9]